MQLVQFKSQTRHAKNSEYTYQNEQICITVHQRLQPLASPELEILPPWPPSKLETYKVMRNVRKAHITSAKSHAAGVQGTLKGPGSSGVLDALWCNLSLFWEHFIRQIYSLIFIINLLLIFFFFYPTQLEREKIKLKREILENSPQSGRVGVSGALISLIYKDPRPSILGTSLQRVKRSPTCNGLTFMLLHQ